MRIIALLLLATALFGPAFAAAGTALPPVADGEYRVRDFRFDDGQTLPELRLHYRTLGTPHRDAGGRIDNAVLILHGTGGSGAQFLRPQFADELYGPGQPLDVSKYYLVLPDGIGHGDSSKPSDGLRMAFPHYDYADMVRAHYRLLTEGLGIGHLRLIFGTSMGCMHIFVWGQTYPDFAQALMPMACQAVEIAGRNRLWRKAAMDAIRADPAWRQGNYTSQPVLGLRTASSLSVVAGAAPQYLQSQFPDRASTDANWQERFAADIQDRDGNDFLYQLDASRNYNPFPGLARISAPMTWINSADDFINPPELGLAEKALPYLKNARYRLIPSSPQTRGHGTHTWAVFWKQDLLDLLARSSAVP